MNLYENIKNFIQQLWTKKSEQEFQYHLPERNLGYIETALSIYSNDPPWLEDDVKTIGMARTICGEIARLTTMNIEIKAEGSARANYIEQILETNIIPKIRQWVETACAAGEVVIKPNGDTIDMLLPTQYEIVEELNGDIKKIVFLDDYYDAKERKWYTRLEYHELDRENHYHISNRCYKGSQEYAFTTPVNIEDTRWNGLAEDIDVQGVEKVLCGLLRIPGANNISIGSDSGLPVFSDAISELQDLDTAYSRMNNEVYDSKKIVLLDSDRFMTGGQKLTRDKTALKKQYHMPDYVRVVEGGDEPFYQEITPVMQTADRIQGINLLLSQIGFKCGFSNGYFVFNEQTGLITATQVESDDRRTLQTISDLRDALEHCINDLVYALDKLADAYKLAPRGTYEITYDMQDLTQNHEEDSQKWWAFVQGGYVPFWYYLVRCEGLTEDEAKQIEAMGKQDEELELEDEEE